VKKFGFWFDYDQTLTFTHIANKLLEFDEFQFTGFIINDRYYDYAENNLKHYSKLYKFYPLLEKAFYITPTKEEREYFEYLDNKYFLSKCMYSDRHLNKLNYKKVLNSFIVMSNIFKKFIDEEKIDIFMFNCVASSYSHLFYYVLQDNNVNIIIPTHTGLDNTVFLSSNPYNIFDKAIEDYKNLKLKDFNGNIINRANKIMQRIRKYKPAYKDIGAINQKQKFQFPSLNRVKVYLQNRKFYKNDYTQFEIHERVKNILYLKYNIKYIQKYFENCKVIKDANYIYFPLHFEPEIATLVLHQYNHLSIIDIISKHMPLNWKLVVKEHPAMIGQREAKFYEEIKKYPNVVLLHSSCNSQQIIDNAKIVFSLSGTVIFESIVLKKPVIFTGPTRYEGFNLGINSKNIFEFEYLIRQALNYEYNEESILKMVVSILANSYDFIFAEPLGRMEVLEDKNIEKIAKAIIEYINE